ncbi:hypothetical protein J2S43_000018 [Catenuloplanes nepalensis]|uniref:Uncharacterized protein n=1 Tax=Catenuloplanes nepalensis TaxID=587533 RepID=A0ABT9MJL9_9ACTN|nr:hypothetical protein [Catenuloplanes nepalensis]MDP9791506.1 hypothetical protein [Catenuloplanes nepalensis]
MSMDSRSRLPLTIDRRFRPWRYQASHRQLILSTDAPGKSTEFEIVFLDVLAMQIRFAFDRLLIADAGRRPEIERFAEIPERHDDRYLRLTVSDGEHEGFVVCGAIHVREHPPVE